MTAEPIEAFEALARCVAAADGELAMKAAQQLAAARQLFGATDLAVNDADWDTHATGDSSLATVPKHHVVLLEAARNAVTGERAGSRDGYPHAGCEVSAAGFCNESCCPCQDRRRVPQPSLLDQSA